MIVCKLEGGLGNQMFQYASGISIAMRNQRPINFYWDPSVGDTKRPFLLNEFDNVEVVMFNDVPTGYQTVIDNFNYDEFTIPKEKVFLSGYWQSEKYFKQYELGIRNLFKIDDVLKYTIPNNSVSLHIRRGDYLNKPEVHPTQTLEYYENALKTIGEYNKVFVLSDDIEWCKGNIKFDNVIFVEGQSEFQDMKLMSLCEHNIIANSSFSWWGAWLNNNPNKKVISPCHWFGNNVNLNTNDIIPEGWLKI